MGIPVHDTVIRVWSPSFRITYLQSVATETQQILVNLQSQAAG